MLVRLRLVRRVKRRSPMSLIVDAGLLLIVLGISGILLFP